MRCLAVILYLRLGALVMGCPLCLYPMVDLDGERRGAGGRDAPGCQGAPLNRRLDGATYACAVGYRCLDTAAISAGFEQGGQMQQV